jgi:hypothetical protein
VTFLRLQSGRQKGEKEKGQKEKGEKEKGEIPFLFKGGVPEGRGV